MSADDGTLEYLDTASFVADQYDNCRAKHRHATEVSARVSGKARMDQGSEPLFIYRCAYCSGWHLTKKERAPYWSAATPMAEVDDYADLLGDPHFWDRLVGMPYIEAEPLLRVARRTFTTKSQHEPGDFRLTALVRRLKEELHQLNEQDSKTRWHSAIRNVFGEEGIALVSAEMRRLVALSEAIH